MKPRTKIVVTKRVKIPQRLKGRVEERIKPIPIRNRLRAKKIVAGKETNEETP